MSNKRKTNDDDETYKIINKSIWEIDLIYQTLSLIYILKFVDIFAINEII